MAFEVTENSGYDSVHHAIGFTPTRPLNTFSEMWLQMFLWVLFSSLFVHLIASAIALFALWKHPIGKYMSGSILAMGLLGPLSTGAVSSAVVAFVYRSAMFSMPPFYALLWGIGQTVVSMCVSFSRVLATM